MLAGGGMRTGQVIGATNRLGEYASERPVHFQEIFATVYHALGINPKLITDYLNSLPEGAAKWAAIADWEYSNYVERAHPMLDQLAPNFDITPADIDALFKSKPEYPVIGP